MTNEALGTRYPGSGLVATAVESYKSSPAIAGTHNHEKWHHRRHCRGRRKLITTRSFAGFYHYHNGIRRRGLLNPSRITLMIIGWLNFSRAPTALPYQYVQYCKLPLGHCPIFLILNITELILFILSLVRHSSRETQGSKCQWFTPWLRHNMVRSHLHVRPEPWLRRTSSLTHSCPSIDAHTHPRSTPSWTLRPERGGSPRGRFRERNLPAQTIPRSTRLVVMRTTRLSARAVRSSSPCNSIDGEDSGEGSTRRRFRTRNLPAQTFPLASVHSTRASSPPCQRVRASSPPCS